MWGIGEKNACGWRWMPNPPYSHLYKNECAAHDKAYEAGGSEQDRMDADMDFHLGMIERMKRLPLHSQRIGFTWACIYYLAVRLFGWITFGRNS